MKSILVIFGQEPPQKSQKWWRQFEKVIAQKNLREKIQSRGANFIDIESLTSPGSIQAANLLVNKLSYLTLADGRRLSKLVAWQGYELWWMHYDDLMHEFCLPYTQYCSLLLYLKNFNKVYLYQAPRPALFQYFLRAHNCQCVIFKRFQLKNLLPVPFGVFIQAVISLGFLPWLMITRPRLMYWVSDKLFSPYKCDFRAVFIYKGLSARKIPFVEFMRSIEPWSTVLSHVWQRKRPVFYSTAVIEILHSFTRRFSHFSLSFSAPDPEQRFWFLVATHYFGNLRGTIWSIQAMKFILQWIGVKAAIIASGCNRTFHELLGCKLAHVGTIGIQHGAKTRYYSICDFMPYFDGDKTLMTDQFGVWSNWWKEYYIKNSKAFKPEQLYVSGPMHPVEEEIVDLVLSAGGMNSERRLKVLFISEHLAAPSEVMPYLLRLLEIKDFVLSLKFRPYRDGFEFWLREHHPDILGKVKIFRGSPQQAAAQSDVVVGSHSSAVLEALLQLKPAVFFWTNKWGDYFDIKTLDKEGRFFADNPEELIEKIRKSVNVSREDLKQLQERFFGDPYQNGSKWVVEQAIKFLKK